MQGRWLKREGSSTCLLFLAGWGMGPEPLLEVEWPLDVYLCWEYRSVSRDVLPDLRGYSAVHLLAWSMGVRVAAGFLSGGPLDFVQRIALAGTLSPVHDRLGIPVAAWEEMAQGLDQERLNAFYQAMFEDADQRKRFFAHRPRRNLAGLKRELQVLAGLPPLPEAQEFFTRVVITRRDRIIPARNQLRAWTRTQTMSLTWPHFPFFMKQWPVWLGQVLAGERQE